MDVKNSDRERERERGRVREREREKEFTKQEFFRSRFPKC